MICPVILVCGSRVWTCEATIRAWLAPIHKQWLASGGPDEWKRSGCQDGHRPTMGHGDADGADKIAGAIATSWGWHVKSYPANWDKHGNAAGPIRNREMFSDLQPDRGLAFGALVRARSGGQVRLTGTGDMVSVMNEAGVRVMVVALLGDKP